MNYKYIPLFLIIIILTFILHEGGHFLVGKLLGYEMFMSINKAGIAFRGTVEATWHRTAITMGGPIVTYGQAGLGLWIAYRFKAKWAFPIVFMAFTMRLMAAVISLFSPNDEYQIGQWLGIGVWTLPILAVMGLLALTWFTSRKLGFGWKSWLLSFVLCSAGITGVIFTERFWPAIVW
ncbi:MAG: hypothetical protein AAFX02_05170 [Pseudomonadota bacterium]